MKQGEDKPIDQFATKHKRCNFADVDFEKKIK